MANAPHSGAVSVGQLKHYVRRAYCEPFDKRGWLYADGTFKLEAYTASSDPAEHRVLDCGFLRFVRRGEAQRYIARLKAKGHVECDDHTPLGEIGAV